MGRLPADKESVDHKYIVNDKDRRRNAVKQGSPACSLTNDTASKGWNKPHNIIMQIGDNIEDFQGVTQEDAYLPAILPEVGTSLFILPNPMYGSW
jgi:predicted secreted acid phosphatase